MALKQDRNDFLLKGTVVRFVYQVKKELCFESITDETGWILFFTEDEIDYWLRDLYELEAAVYES